MLALDGVHQAGATQNLGVEAFDRQEEDGEIGGVRRREVVVGNRLGLGANARLQRLGGQFRAGRIGALVRIDQALVVVTRELGVDRQPHRRALFSAPRKADGEVDALAAARLGLDLLGVLVRREHLLEQGFELHLAEHAARLHVGQHALQAADADGQRLHFAEPLVHLLEPVGHLLEAFAQAGFERALQLLVDGLAHLVELGGIGLLQLHELGFHGRAHLRQAPCIRFAQALQLRAERVGQRLLQRRELQGKGIELRVLRARGLGALLHQRALEGGEGLRGFLPRAAGAVGDFSA